MKPAIELVSTDPCACNSGLLYGQCHQPIFDAPEGKMLEAAHAQYANAWSTNAVHYNSQGLYLDQAKELSSKGGILKVLDVGCGLGQGVEALKSTLSTDAWILSIDENPDCLAGAAKLLAIPALPSNLNRMVDEVLPSGRYRSTYGNQQIKLGESPMLLQSNLLIRDPELLRVLDVVGPLDAITLWFIGIHKANSATELAKFFEVDGDADYRMLIEDAVMEMADQRLKTGGFVQIAMRANYPDKVTAERHTREAYSELLREGGYVFDTITARPYTEPPRGVGAVNVGSMRSPVKHLPSFAISMLLRKINA